MASATVEIDALRLRLITVLISGASIFSKFTDYNYVVFSVTSEYCGTTESEQNALNKSSK